jgi:hypothetical protein
MKAYVGESSVSALRGTERPSRTFRGKTPLWSRLGVDWVARSVPELNTWTGVAFGNGIFVAVSQDGTNRLMTSHDGVTWTARSGLPSSVAFSQSVIFGNGKFLTFGGNSAYISDDGISWTAIAIAGVQFAVSYAAGGGSFAGIFRLSSGQVSIMSSMNGGMTWTAAAGTTFSDTGTRGLMFFANGKFFTIGSTSQSNATGDSRNFSSADGVSWASSPMTEPYGARSIKSVVYANGAYYAVSANTSFRSQDAVTWEQIGSLSASNPSSLLHAEGLFICGNHQSGTSTQARIHTSPDGIGWTARNEAPRSSVRGLAYGNGTVVAVGSPNGGTSLLRVMSSRALPELSLQATEYPRVVGGESQSPAVVKDATYMRWSSATLATDYIVSPRFGSTVANDIAITSSNTSVLSNPDQSGLSSFVSGGNATLTATDSSRGLSASLILQPRTYSASFADSFQYYNTGTAARSASDAIDGSLAPGKQKAIYSTKDHATQTYARNPSCWVYGKYDLTCLSVWNSSGGIAQCGTLISPRHVIWAAHYPLPVGTTLRWVRADGVVVAGTIAAKARPASYSVYYPDFEIGLLSADIGAGISFARVMPDDWRSKFPSLSHRQPIPVCGTDQDENALVTDWAIDGTASFGCQTPSIQSRLDFHEPLVTGDSGHPCFLLLEGVQQPVLMTVWTYGGAGSGTSIAANKSLVNSLMTSLGGGYQLTPVDLSGFPSY